VSQQYVAWQDHATDDRSCDLGKQEMAAFTRCSMLRKFSKTRSGGAHTVAVWKPVPRRRVKSFVTLMQLVNMIRLSSPAELSKFHICPDEDGNLPDHWALECNEI